MKSLLDLITPPKVGSRWKHRALPYSVYIVISVENDKITLTNNLVKHTTYTYLPENFDRFYIQEPILMGPTMQLIP